MILLPGGDDTKSVRVDTFHILLSKGLIEKDPDRYHNYFRLTRAGRKLTRGANV